MKSWKTVRVEITNLDTMYKAILTAYVDNTERFYFKEMHTKSGDRDMSVLGFYKVLYDKLSDNTVLGFYSSAADKNGNQYYDKVHYCRKGDIDKHKVPEKGMRYTFTIGELKAASLENNNFIVREL